jgi:hypothetical protein
MGPNIDPLPWLQGLVLKGPPAADIEQSGQGTAGTDGGALLNATANTVAGMGPVADSFAAIATAVDSAMQFRAVLNITSWQDAVNALFNPTKTAADAGENLGHDIGAVVLRSLVVVLGLVMIFAFLFHLTRPVRDVATEVAATGALVAA